MVCWMTAGAGGTGWDRRSEGISGKELWSKVTAATRAITATSVPAQAASGPCGKVSNW